MPNSDDTVFIEEKQWCFDTKQEDKHEEHVEGTGRNILLCNNYIARPFKLDEIWTITEGYINIVSLFKQNNHNGKDKYIAG